MSHDKKDVFISYCSRTDSHHAEFLCNLLQGQGVKCWISPRDIPPAKSWAEAILDGIGDCSLMAVLVSSGSLASSEVGKEVDLANNKIPILPIRLEDVPLSGALQYHLSSKQWVNAIDGERMSRFLAAMNGILRLLPSSKETVESDSSLLGKARILATDLNKRHAEYLDVTNARISARQRESIVSISYPLNIGATGIELIAEFDCNKKTILIYADSVSDGDPLKAPFTWLIENSFNDDFPTLIKPPRARRWKFVTLLPVTKLTTPLLDESTDKCFERFANNVRELSDRFIAALLKWAVKSKLIGTKIKELELKLKSLFPASEGWYVGSSEGERLDTFRKAGKLNVYKESWRPQEDDHRSLGLLSFSLEAEGNFLQNLKIGISKYEPWLDISTYSQRILEAGRARLDDTVKCSERYPLEFSLPNEWGDCGLSNGELTGNVNLDRFVDEVLDRFKKLKDLESLLDEACSAIPALHGKTIEDNLENPITDCSKSPTYLQNNLRLLARSVADSHPSERITVLSQFRHDKGRSLSSLLLAVKVGNFDAAVKFHFDSNKLTTEIVSLEPPDFEKAIVQEFFNKRRPNLELAITNVGLSLPRWLDTVKTAITDNVTPYFEVMDELARHLEQCRELSETVASLLRSELSDSDDWIVLNYVPESLEPGNGIAIYRRAWLANPQKEGSRSPLHVHIMPNKACFDALNLVITFGGQTGSELERAIGRINGACDFAFRHQVTESGKPQFQEIWRSPLRAPFQHTGGCSFGTPLLGQTERTLLDQAVREIGGTIKQLEPLLADLCRQHNHIESKLEYKAQREARKKEMLDAIPCDGVTVGNKTLKMKLGWDDSLYDRIRDALVRDGHLERGKGKGGSVIRRPESNEPDTLNVSPVSSAE